MQIQSTGFTMPILARAAASAQQPASESTQLPDVATIQARAADMGSPAETVSSETAAKTGSNIAKYGTMALVGLAAFAAMASPALAQRHHGGHRPHRGGGYQVRPYQNPYNRGHRHGGWRPIPIPIPLPLPIPVPGPTYPGPSYPGGGWDASRHHTIQGNMSHGAHHYGYGADGIYHHFDEFGHVNDNTGHYSICQNGYGGYYYNYNGTCW